MIKTRCGAENGPKDQTAQATSELPKRRGCVSHEHRRDRPCRCVAPCRVPRGTEPSFPGRFGGLNPGRSWGTLSAAL